MVTIYDMRSAEVDSIVRRQLAGGQPSVVRLMATVSVGYRDRTRGHLAPDDRARALGDDVRAVLVAYRVEGNSIVRAVMRRVLTWVQGAGVRLDAEDRETLDAAAAAGHEVHAADAADALDLLNDPADRRTIPLARLSVLQGDDRWPAVVSGIYTLAGIRDHESRDAIRNATARSENAEVRTALEESERLWG